MHPPFCGAGITLPLSERSRMDIKESVARGADLLDDTTPGWRERINTYTLLMSNPGWCVLGQLFGSFFTGTATLGIGGEQAAYYGFDFLTEEMYVGAYDELQEAWLAVL
jgi:hypothetical protein